MKKTLCAVALAVVSTGIAAPAAHADTPRCVSKAEYRAVHKSMSQRRVHQIFDTAGHRAAYASSGGFTSEIRSYPTCRRNSAVSVSFGNARVDGKSAVWSG